MYLSNPFKRLGYVSELHYGQLLNAFKNCSKTVLHSAQADILCLPTHFSPSMNNELLCIIARYESTKLPKRDTLFLAKVRDVLIRGMEIADQRLRRQKLIETLRFNMKTLTSNASSQYKDQIIIQSLDDMEAAFALPPTIYLLDSDGMNYTICAHSTGQPDEDSPTDEFIRLASRLCRHGFIVQIYRGKHTLIDTKWER